MKLHDLQKVARSFYRSIEVAYNASKLVNMEVLITF